MGTRLAGESAIVTGTASISTHDDPTVTLTICKTNTVPCTAGNTLDTQTAQIDPATGTWTATSKDLRTCVLGLLCTGPGTSYLTATQNDLAGNRATSTTTQANFS